MKRRVHSREFKLEVARQVVNGEKRPTQACREHNLFNSALDRGRKEYEQRGEAAFTKQAPPMSMKHLVVRKIQKRNTSPPAILPLQVVHIRDCKALINRRAIKTSHKLEDNWKKYSLNDLVLFILVFHY